MNRQKFANQNILGYGLFFIGVFLVTYFLLFFGLEAVINYLGNKESTIDYNKVYYFLERERVSFDIIMIIAGAVTFYMFATRLFKSGVTRLQQFKAHYMTAVVLAIIMILIASLAIFLGSQMTGISMNDILRNANGVTPLYFVVKFISMYLIGVFVGLSIYEGGTLNIIITLLLSAVLAILLYFTWMLFFFTGQGEYSVLNVLIQLAYGVIVFIIVRIRFLKLSIKS